MKFRTILLASAAVMFAGSAMAADLTNPFYLPGQGKFASDTTVDYSRTKLEHNSAVPPPIRKFVKSPRLPIPGPPGMKRKSTCT